jgi:hypothetical protein
MCVSWYLLAFLNEVADLAALAVIMDDDLTPLERARLRKAGTLGI